MNNKQVISKLRKILDLDDVESDGLINRKVSSKHNGEIDVLLENLSLLVSYLKFDAIATRIELFEVRSILEH